MIGALPGGERALDLDAVPHPDRGRLADAAAAAQQPDPGRRRRLSPRSSAAPSRSTRTRTTRRSRCPTAEAALLALRQQQIIAEETGVANTVDPLGGSWFVEALTNETEREVWRYLDEIDRRGGMVAAIAEGYPQHEVADAAYRYQREFDAGERRIVGSTPTSTRPRTRPIPVLTVPPGSFEAQMARLERTRRERDAAAVESALAGLRDAASPARHERDEPHAAFPPLRRRLRDARRAVRGLARRLRGVPRTGPGLTQGPQPRYDAVMYLDALSFLEDERDGWRPFEALSQLSDAELEQPIEGAHGWSGRDLMGHLVHWQILALDVAKELAVGEHSARKDASDADFEARGDVVVNAEVDALWRAKPLAEVRGEFARVAGELRGYLTVVPETRWVKNGDQQRFFYEETIEHYDDHRPELAAILEAAGAG